MKAQSEQRCQRSVCLSLSSASTRNLGPRAAGQQAAASSVVDRALQWKVRIRIQERRHLNRTSARLCGRLQEISCGRPAREASAFLGQAGLEMSSLMATRLRTQRLQHSERCTPPPSITFTTGPPQQPNLGWPQLSNHTNRTAWHPLPLAPPSLSLWSGPGRQVLPEARPMDDHVLHIGYRLRLGLRDHSTME